MILNLASGGIWSQTQSDWHRHAKNWLLAQEWKRAKLTEAPVKRASQAAWFSALAALASTLSRAYFDLDWSLKASAVQLRLTHIAPP